MVPGIKRMPVLPGAPRVATGSGSPKIDDASRRGGNDGPQVSDHLRRRSPRDTSGLRKVRTRQMARPGASPDPVTRWRRRCVAHGRHAADVRQPESQGSRCRSSSPDRAISTATGDGLAGAGDGIQRLHEQDEDGLDAELLFAPIFASRFLEKIRERDVYLSMVQAYNTWLADDYCTPAPDRLIANA